MKNLGLISILFAWLMGQILTKFWHSKGSTKTLSQVAASNRRARHIFLWGLVLSGSLFGIFMQQWFIPHFELGNAFRIVLFLSLMAQALTGIIVDKGGRQGLIHSTFAYSLGIGCFILSLILLTSNLTTEVRTLIIVPIVFQGLILASTIFRYDKYFLLRQQLFFLSFHSMILFATYFG